MRNDILLIGLVPLISAIPQLSYNHTAAHRGDNGLMGNFTASPEQEEVASYQSSSKTQSVVTENEPSNQLAALPMPNGAVGVIPSQATTELQLKMQKAFQDFANAIAQIAGEAQVQASQLTVNPQAIVPPAVNPSPQPIPQPTPQSEAQPQPDAAAQPSKDPSPQPNQEAAPQQPSESPAPSEEDSEPPTPAGSTRSLLDNLLPNNSDNSNDVSSIDNYQLQFQSSPLPQYNPVYVKYDYPTAYDVSSLPALNYYAAAYPVVSYNGYSEDPAYHNLAQSKPSSSSALSASSVKHLQQSTPASTKPKAKELASASNTHHSQETKPSSSSSSHQQQLSAASTDQMTPSTSIKSSSSKQNAIQASSIHPQQQTTPLIQELKAKAQPSIPSQPSTSQLDKVLTQIETESAPMLKRRERFNNMADHRIVIEDKFSDKQKKLAKSSKKHRFL